MILYYRNRETVDSGIFKEYNGSNDDVALFANSGRKTPKDLPEVPDKIAAANAQRDMLDERLDNLMDDPGQLCGGVLEFDNHSSSYLLNSGGSIHITLKKLIINGSLNLENETDVVMENVSIYFNFAGTDPYISVDSGSSLTLRNVTVDSDVPVRIYGFESNITMENSFINKVKGNGIILGKLTMNNSYFAGLEETFVIDRSLFELREGHINGNSEGIIRFVDAVYYISNSAVSNIYGLNARSTSSGEISNSIFYNNKDAIFSDGLFKISENLSIHNTSFLGNERDMIDFQIDVEVQDCIFTNSTDKTIGDSDGRRGANRAVNRDEPRASIVMKENIFFNNTFLEFSSVNLTTAGNVYYESREGYDIFDCTVFMNGETFFKENKQGVQVNDIRGSDITLEELTFINWYCPFSTLDSSINASGSTFYNCSIGFHLSMNTPEFDVYLGSCTFSDCITPIAIDGYGGLVNIEQLTVLDCTHAVDTYYSDVNIDDALIITDGWNIRMQHADVNALNITVDESKTVVGTDSTLNILLEMELLLRDYSDNPLPGVFIDVEEIGVGPSYTFKSDTNGIVKMILINFTKEEAGTTYYDVYRIYHESEQWGYLYEEVNVMNGDFLILRIGFSDLAIGSFDQSCEDPYHGMEMTTTVSVKNLDLMPAVNCTVYFYMDFNVIEERSIPALGPDESTEMIFAWKAFQGGQMLGVHVDPVNEIFESNESNNYISEFVQVIAEPEKPVAQLAINLNKIFVGETVLFNASGSTTGTPEILYNYDFDDGNNTGWVTDSEVVHTYNQTGLFFPSCKVKDGYDRISSNSSDLILEVMEPPPQPKKPISHIAPPQHIPDTEFITVDSLIIFDPIGSYSPDGAEIVKYTWNFGDGEVIELRDDNTTSHKFSDDMNYTVSLVVTDSRNLDSLPATIRIKVVNLPPIAVAEFKPASVKEGEKVIFSSEGTSDPDDDPNTELRYEWIFPNGTINSGKMISKIFDEAGVYNISFRVTDDDSAYDYYNWTVFVIKGENGPPVENGTGEEKGILAACWDFISDYWLWSVCILVVLLLAGIIFIRTRFQSKKSRFRNLIYEQKTLEERIREKEVKKSYAEAEKKIKKRILSGERIDFTISEGEEPTYDDDIDYYGLDNVVEYDGKMGIAGTGDIVYHDRYEEDEYYEVEEYTDNEEEGNYYQDGDYDDEDEDDERGMETDEEEGIDYYQDGDYDDDEDEDDNRVIETDEEEGDYYQDGDYDDDEDEEDETEMERDGEVDYQDDDYDEEDDGGIVTENLDDSSDYDNEVHESDIDVMEMDHEHGGDKDRHYEFRVESRVEIPGKRAGMKQNDEEDDDWNWTED